MAETLNPPTLGLSEAELGLVQSILRRHIPDCRVVAFGSRAKGNNLVYSDLDLALFGPERLSLVRMGELREAFQMSTLPMRVDILDMQSAPTSFLANIQGPVIQTPSSLPV
jgi:predicted nucleotidyltransferase